MSQLGQIISAYIGDGGRKSPTFTVLWGAAAEGRLHRKRCFPLSPLAGDWLALLTQERLEERPPSEQQSVGQGPGRSVGVAKPEASVCWGVEGGEEVRPGSVAGTIFGRSLRRNEVGTSLRGVERL